MSAMYRDVRFVAAAPLLVVLAFVALFGPAVAPYPDDLVDVANRLQGPSTGHVLGTDEFGRDIFTRILLGARLTMLVGLGSVAIASLLGTSLGMLAGYYGGWVELALMRVVDAVLSFPPFLLAIFVIAFLGPKLENLIITIGILFMPRYARVAHVVAAAARDMEYVQAARSIGAQTWRVVLRAVLPNVYGPLIVQVSLGIGSAVLLEAGLSYLGLGPPPPAASWGRSIEQSARFMDLNPHAVIWPSVAISATVLGLNILGDSLRDHLDPRLRGR